MRDPRYEQWLTNVQKVPWHYEGFISFSQVDEALSLQNRARIGRPIIDDQVERFMHLTLAGSEPPALIAVQTKTGKYLLVTGNHRMQALKKIGRDGCDMYLVDVRDATVIERLIRSANVGEGTGVATRAEQIAHAMYLVTAHGYTHVAAAEAMGVPSSAVSHAMEIQNTERRLEAAGVDTKPIPKSAMRGMVTLPDPVLVPLAQTIKEAKLTIPEVVKLTSAVRGASRSEAAMLEEVQRFRQQDWVQARAAGRPTQDKGTRTIRALLRDLGSATNHATFLFDRHVAGMRPTDDELKRVRESWSKTLGAMEVTLAALGNRRNGA